MSIKRVAVSVILVLGILALVPAGAVPARSEMRTYVGGYEAVGFVCNEYGTYDLDYASADAHADLGSACFDLQGDTKVEVSQRDITGTNVSGYYQFNGCSNCSCDWCPVTTDPCPTCRINSGTWGYFCNEVSLEVPAGATELQIIILLVGECGSTVPPTVGSVIADFYV